MNIYLAKEKFSQNDGTGLRAEGFSRKCRRNACVATVGSGSAFDPDADFVSRGVRAASASLLCPLREYVFSNRPISVGRSAYL